MEKCPLSNNKRYITPTTDWLKPLNEFIVNLDNSNTIGMLILAELVKKEKIIVKITSNFNKKLMIIDKILSEEPNFIKTYCVFPCYENLKILNKKYKNSNSFCNEDKNNKEKNKLITLELMKKYKNGSITNLKNKLTIEKSRKILEQLILAQINVFYKYGFVHNDINLSNILFKIAEKENVYEYKVCDYIFNLKNSNVVTLKKLIKKGEIIPVISDFDKSKCYSSNVFNEYDNKFINKDTFWYDHVLLINLNNSVNVCLNLIKNDYSNVQIIKNNITNIMNGKLYEDAFKWSTKALDNYYRNKISWEEFRKLSINYCVNHINSIMNIFNNNDIEFIPNRCMIDL